MKKINLILSYGTVSVEYINIKNFKIKYPFLILDYKNKVNLEDVDFIKIENKIYWKNLQKKWRK